jgi:hypothetical protein
MSIQLVARVLFTRNYVPNSAFIFAAIASLLLSSGSSP